MWHFTRRFKFFSPAEKERCLPSASTIAWQIRDYEQRWLNDRHDGQKNDTWLDGLIIKGDDDD